MRKFMILMLLALIPVALTSCHKHRGHRGTDGTNGVDGQDGTDGLDGSNGLNGIGFDYVRGINGAELCESFLVIPADLVIPAEILNLAPPIDWYKLETSTLTFGTVAVSFRYYLAPMMAGEYCLVERGDDIQGWEALGQVSLLGNGLLAVVPLGTLQVAALDPGVLEQGVLVTLDLNDGEEEDEDSGCVLLKFDRSHLHFGHNIRINFNRD